jgi:hypothetical protein
VAGLGALGAPGGCGVAAVVNDHTGPVVVPTAFLATILQKYIRELVRVEGVYDAAA